MSKPMREAMPTVAAWIDDLRAAFGAENIDPQIREGMQGHTHAFYARENGHEVGTPLVDLSGVSINASEINIGPLALPKKERR